MDKRQKRTKTIDFNATKRQRASQNNNQGYFNPYARDGNYQNVQSYSERSNEDVYPYLNYSNYAAPPSYYPSGRLSDPKEQRKKEFKSQNKLTKAQVRKNKKKRRRRAVLRLLAVMSLTVILVWGGITLKDALTYPKISYQVVQMGSINNAKTFEGIIIRNEKVYYSDKEGTMQTLLGEGEKVKKEGVVCALVDGSSLLQTEEERNKASTELYEAADKRKEISYYQDTVYRINNKMKETMNAFYSERLGETTDYVYALRSELDKQVNERTDVYVEEQKNLVNQKTTAPSSAEKLTALNSRIQSLQYASQSDQSGIVSYFVDGKENELSSKVIGTFSYAGFKETRESHYQNVGNNTYIKKGMPLYKIVFDDTWYIVSYVDAKTGEFFKEGNSYPLSFNNEDSSEVTFALKSKISEENRVKLVFETNEQVNRFLHQRVVDFSIGNKNEEGLKIPLQAIVEQNMLKVPSAYKVEQGSEIGVYRKTGEITEFVKINPQYEKDNTLYVLQEIGSPDKLQLNDLLVQSKTNQTAKLDQIETAQGVYVINGKIAQFKAIEIYLQNNEYALIKYFADSKLKEMDKIISNPKSIKQDQLLQHMNIQNE